MIIRLKIQKLLFREVQDQNVVQFLKIFVTKVTKNNLLLLLLLKQKFREIAQPCSMISNLKK